MAGGRRNAAKSTSGRGSVTNDDSKNRTGGIDPNTVNTSVLSPKHIPLPAVPRDSDVLFEAVLFVYSTVACFLQYLQLYRTIWWLPNSYTRYAMNFYLIDPYLVGFIVLILSRRLVWCACRSFIATCIPASVRTVVHKTVGLLLLVSFLAALGWCGFYIVQTHPLVNIFYLCYPISVYIILFGATIDPFFNLSSLPSSSKDKARAGVQSKTTVSRGVFHVCCLVPPTVREEVDVLKTDFNNRMKQILFSSLLNAYYAGFVPCCFAQTTLQYDIYWATQHMAFVWLGCFTMHIVQCYPAKYCDTLHRAALHLGCWVKVEGRPSHLPAHQWAESVLWQQGSLVKHLKETYKADGISNAAEPGNSSHARFYTVFVNPAPLMCSVLGLQLALVVVQLFVLLRSSEWQHITATTLLLFFNNYTLFKLARDYMIFWKIYHAESILQDKPPG